MKFSQFIVFIFILFVGSYSASLLSAQLIPSIDVQKKQNDGKVSLAGEWAFKWGEWTPLHDIAMSKANFDLITLPNFVNVLVDDTTLEKYKFGTYMLTLSNLSNTFERPAIRMRAVNDAWQAWWIDGSGKSQFLSESGRISKSYAEQQFRFKTHILQLPKDVETGTLVIYVSTQLYKRGGVYGELEVQEFQSANRSLLFDMATRIAIIAIGLLVVFQNILFYIYRPTERVLLLLGIFSFAILLRVTVSSDYVYYLLGDPANFNILTKLEYISIVWPVVAAVHFFSELSPSKLSSRVVKFGYVIVAGVVIFTFLAPLSMVISYLLYYQVTLGIFSLYALWLIIHSISVGHYRSWLMGISGFVLFLGVLSDIIATQSSTYNIYVAEYTLFLFLFVQTQAHSLRFVSALDTAEDLTSNLQKQVAEKTRELSLRNVELEDKADYLKVQHDRIKQLSKTDHLTGLYNRQTFDEYLELKFSQAIQRSENLSLVILDIDNFKKVNDSYGHPVGDKCLKAMAEYLKQVDFRKDDIVARYGGEEFVIILSNASIDSAREVSQKICDRVSQIKLIAGKDIVKLTASFGIAELIYNQAKSTSQLLKRADEALYQAKAQGKNRVVTAIAEDQA